MAINQIYKNLNAQDLLEFEFEDLVMPEVMGELEILANDPQFDLEAGAAFEFYDNLSTLLNKYANEFGRDKRANNQLHILLQKLFWKAFQAIGEKTREQGLSENVVFSLRQGIGIKYYLNKALSSYEFGIGPDVKQRRGWVYSLENNQEILGDNLIVLPDGKKLQPTIQNWLKVYNDYSPLTNQRSKFQQINFIRGEANIRNLSEEDMKNLGKVVEIYDWLLFSPSEPGIIIEQVQQTKTPYMVAQKGVMDENLDLRKDTIGEQPLAPPEIPAKPQAVKKVEGPSTLMDMKAEIESKKRKAQEEIDKKLEELKRKVQK